MRHSVDLELASLSPRRPIVGEAAFEKLSALSGDWARSIHETNGALASAES